MQRTDDGEWREGGYRAPRDYCDVLRVFRFAVVRVMTIHNVHSRAPKCGER